VSDRNEMIRGGIRFSPFNEGVAFVDPKGLDMLFEERKRLHRRIAALERRLAVALRHAGEPGCGHIRCNDAGTTKGRVWSRKHDVRSK